MRAPVIGDVSGMAPAASLQCRTYELDPTISIVVGLNRGGGEVSCTTVGVVNSGQRRLPRPPPRDGPISNALEQPLLKRAPLRQSGRCRPRWPTSSYCFGKKSSITAPT